MRIAVLLLLVAACDVEPEPVAVFVDITQGPGCLGWHFQVRPSDTSPSIGGGHTAYPWGADTYQPNRLHEVYRGTYGNPCQVPASPKLVVFLPGHTQAPAKFGDFLRTAVSQGYHVIGLDYPNPTALTFLCDDDLDCYGGARDEIVFGRPSSAEIPLAEDSPEDAIDSRLRRLLIHLDDVADPHGDWGHFLTWSNGQRVIRWGQIVIAGHGGYEVFLAKHKPVRRVVMLGTVSDGTGTTLADATPASWIEPASNPEIYYGLINTLDTDRSRYVRARRNWNRLGLTPSPPVDIDGAYQDAHQLEDTTCGGCSALDKHDDVATNLAQYGGAWRYMLGSN